VETPATSAASEDAVKLPAWMEDEQFVIVKTDACEGFYEVCAALGMLRYLLLVSLSCDTSSRTMPLCVGLRSSGWGGPH